MSGDPTPPVPVGPWSPAPVPVPPPPKDRKNLVIGIVVAVVLAIGAGAAVWFTRGGLEGNTPERTVSDFLEAALSGDTVGMRARVCDELQGEFEGLPDLRGGFELMRDNIDFRVTGSQVVDVDHVVVSFTISLTLGGETRTEASSVDVFRKDGDWKICA